MSFFTQTPCVSWLTLIKSLVPFQPPRKPSVFEKAHLSPPLLPPGLTLTLSDTTPVTQQTARELSLFYYQYYTAEEDDLVLSIPPGTLFSILQHSNVRTCLLRDRKKSIVASCIHILLSETQGLITWLCVHPQWRKKGLSHILFSTLYSYGITANWFRNDTLFQSYLPPIWYSSMMTRTIHRIEKPSPLIRLCRNPSEETDMIELWKRQHPSGLVFTSSGQGLVKCLHYTYGDESCWLLFQSTFERHRQTGETRCELLEVVQTGFKDSYRCAQIVEMMIQHLPYNRVEAPTHIPHIDALWKKGGISSWFVTGLDPGIPFQRPILPLQFA